MRCTGPATLRRLGVLGMNRLRAEYIGRYNPRALYPRVDDKHRTKLLALAQGLAVPPLYGSLQQTFEVRGLARVLADHATFVIKPARGSAGKGILVVRGRQGADFETAGGQVLPLRTLQQHVYNTLSGLYSLGGHRDRALIEYAVAFDEAFEGFSFQGVPDVRVIVFRGYPVMAMMRLPTRTSSGRANLHQGAIGAGLSLADGRACGAAQYNRPVTHHPDTGRDLRELIVPRWPEVLHLAARSYEVAGLGYLGADIVLDRQRGPLLLELNARPGLSIQVANRAGLHTRLRRIEVRVQEQAGPEPVSDRVRWAVADFGGDPSATRSSPG